MTPVVKSKPHTSQKRLSAALSAAQLGHVWVAAREPAEGSPEPVAVPLLSPIPWSPTPNDGARVGDASTEDVPTRGVGEALLGEVPVIGAPQVSQ